MKGGVKLGKRKTGKRERDEDKRRGGRKGKEALEEGRCKEREMALKKGENVGHYAPLLRRATIADTPSSWRMLASNCTTLLSLQCGVADARRGR